MKRRLFAIGTVFLLSACGGSGAPASQAPSVAPTQPPVSPLPAAPAPSVAPTQPPVSPVPAAPVASVSPAVLGSSSSGALSPLLTSYPNVDMGHLALWVAEDEGLFVQNGLDVTDEHVSSSSATLAVLLSGQINIAQAGGSDAVSAAAGGADVVVLAVEIPVYTYLLEVPPSITTVDQIKGGTIGIDSFGSSPDVAVRVALSRAGLDPDKDVNIVPVGDIPTRAAALMQGAIQGTVLNPPSSLTVEDNGFHPLINMAELKLPASSQATIAQRSWVAAHRDLVQRYVDTLVEAGNHMRQDEAGTVSIMSKYLQNNDARAISYTYDFYVGQVYPPAPFPQPDMLQDSINQLAKSNSSIAGFDASRILDPSFVQSAVDRGLVAS